MNGEVILLPGLWMPATVMALIAARLAKAGLKTYRFGYWGRAPLEANIERLARIALERVRRPLGAPRAAGRDCRHAAGRK